MKERKKNSPRSLMVVLAVTFLASLLLLTSCNGKILPVTGDQYFVLPGMTTPIFSIGK